MLCVQKKSRQEPEGSGVGKRKVGTGGKESRAWEGDLLTANRKAQTEAELKGKDPNTSQCPLPTTLQTCPLNVEIIETRKWLFYSCPLGPM